MSEGIPKNTQEWSRDGCAAAISKQFRKKSRFDLKHLSLNKFSYK